MELMAVVAIVAIIASIAFPSYSIFTKQTNRSDATRKITHDPQGVGRSRTDTGCEQGAEQGGSPRGVQA